MVWFLLLLSAFLPLAAGRNITLAIVSGTSAFFEAVPAGWNKKCAELGVTCLYRDSNFSDPEFVKDIHIHPCAWQMRRLFEMQVDGIAAKCGFNVDPEVFREAKDKGIPVVVFDTSPPTEEEKAIHVEPAAYIGTDNAFMGRTLARLLKQLKPAGGTYAIIAKTNSVVQQERIDGFVEEIEKDNEREDRAHWFEVERNLIDPDHSVGAMEKMEYFAAKKPTAMITMYQGPMREENWTQFIDNNRDITMVGTDGSDFQLEYLSQRYVDGLVGQLPYEMGAEAAQVLYDIIMTGENQEPTVPGHPLVVPTNLVAYNLIPLELPALDVEQNLLEGLRWVGVFFFIIISIAALGCIGWTLINRHSIVIRASQPFFLCMTAGGVILMAAALVPLSIDDKGYPIEDTKATAICMSIPWLAFTGFTVMFSALFAKTWRVNKIFRTMARYKRTTVTEKDVLLPFLVLMSLNLIVLISWTIVDPLTYVRRFDEGTDYWNREIESRGSCQSEHAIAYLIPLGFINIIVLAIASWQVWQSRDIESEFSESNYIALAVFSTLQAFMTGVPIVTVVRDIPRAFYIVLTLLITLLCFVILLLIFLPKLLMHRRCLGMSVEEQRKLLAVRVRQSRQLDEDIKSSFSAKHRSDMIKESKDGGALSGPSVSEYEKDSTASQTANGSSEDQSPVPKTTSEIPSSELMVPRQVIRHTGDPIISTLSSAIETIEEDEELTSDVN